MIAIDEHEDGGIELVASIPLPSPDNLSRNEHISAILNTIRHLQEEIAAKTPQILSRTVGPNTMPDPAPVPDPEPIILKP